MTNKSPSCAAESAERSLPELLLPAGSPESLAAAIEGGADAVYFGASSFSARARAVNFTDGEIASALRLCRTYGVKAYAAVNTRIRDVELERALELVSLLYFEGTDAVICADPGLALGIRARFPEMQLHASTQLTPEFLSDARALEKLGFSRMVAPRELSLGDLRTLCENSSIEIEAFVHGAHCVSLSGQCLMSSMIGGRSANRGECAQPCRLPWKLGGREGYLLSLADMCYAPDIPGIISSGVRSLKIEGRQKNADYVYGVCRIYRRLLDERRCATEDEIAYMASLFERGFTDGYLRRSYAGMTGVRASDAQSAAAFAGLSRTVPVRASLKAESGEKARMCMESPFASASVLSEEDVRPAEKSPLTEERARASLSKLGGTGFSLESFELETDGASYLGASELNLLRRSAVAALTDPPARTENAGHVGSGEISIPYCAARKIPEEEITEISDRTESAHEKNGRTAEFMFADAVPEEAFEFFDEIYLPYTEMRDGCALSLPPFMTDELAAAIAERIVPGSKVLAHTVGQIYFARSLGADVTASFRLNVFNRDTADLLGALGARCITLSPELGSAALRDIARTAHGALSAVAYGKLPLMHTVRCMMHDPLRCRRGSGGFSGKIRPGEACREYITDRKNVKFFVVGNRDCTNTVFNSVPVWTADNPSAIRGRGIAEHFVFTDESADRVRGVIGAYRTGRAPDFPVRRIK